MKKKESISCVILTFCFGQLRFTFETKVCCSFSARDYFMPLFLFVYVFMENLVVRKAKENEMTCVFTKLLFTVTQNLSINS